MLNVGVEKETAHWQAKARFHESMKSEYVFCEC